MHAHDRVLNPREAALLLGISPRQLQRYRLDGKIGYVRYGRRAVRYRLTDLADFIDRQAVPRQAS